MASTYVLSAIAGPVWRLGVVQNALPISFIGGGICFMLMMNFFAIFPIALIHGMVAYLSYRDPYFMNVLMARWTTRPAQRRHASGGNIYAA